MKTYSKVFFLLVQKLQQSRKFIEFAVAMVYIFETDISLWSLR